MELIAVGAEARIYLDKLNKIVVKERVKKGYRLEVLDNDIRKFRTRREAKIMEKAAKIIPVPEIISFSEKDMKIKMKFIKGDKLSEKLDKYSEEKRIDICKLIGKQVAHLHNRDIIHGDLTTSNMIFKRDKLYFIDFGLSFIDSKVEHKAVDLHLLKQALESKHHWYFESSFSSVLYGYKKSCKEYKHIIERFYKVEERGRYKRKGNFLLDTNIYKF